MQRDNLLDDVLKDPHARRVEFGPLGGELFAHRGEEQRVFGLGLQQCLHLRARARGVALLETRLDEDDECEATQVSAALAATDA